MPHDVTMPQLGMAQDAGKIVSWLKSPGDPVSRGDALFEVETDKAVMEVESPAAGFLSGVLYDAGEDVPVGQVIARIADTAEEAATTPTPSDARAEAADSGGAADANDGADLPEGHAVTMPQLGMAQDSGVLVTWVKRPGEEVAAEDVLFEVETDKSTMEVEAGRKGWLAATLAREGEEVPVGDPVAIISAEKPEAPVARSVKDGAAPAPAPQAPEPAAKPEAAPAARAPATPNPAPAGRLLASPKARRLAREQGLDLARLAEAGHPQPFHVKDLETLRAMPATAPAPEAGAAPAPRRLTASCAEDGVAGFAAWAAEAGAAKDPQAILAALAGASLAAQGPVTVAVERFGATQAYDVPPGRRISAVTPSDADPALLVRDLRDTRLATVAMGAEAMPVLSLTREGAGLAITLECAAAQLDAASAIQLLTDFAGRMEQPLRHLL
jgi:pyruvate dehydrogenase E2 component (dihydrolipoamide acetyltransferase)/2-oxoglutarate dehydrogenase E2 component (dihydrolipoamide succinyltransferase)